MFRKASYRKWITTRSFVCAFVTDPQVLYKALFEQYTVNVDAVSQVLLEGRFRAIPFPKGLVPKVDCSFLIASASLSQVLYEALSEQFITNFSP
jgi:hypothetical protein